MLRTNHFDFVSTVEIPTGYESPMIVTSTSSLPSMATWSFTLLEVARSLHPDISVILMTAFGSPEVQAEANRLKVDGYLTEPFPTAQLQDIVKNILAINSTLEDTGDKSSKDLVTEQNVE